MTYHDEFMAPITKALDDLLDSYHIDHEPLLVERAISKDDLDRMADCNCGCGELVHPEDALWGDDHQPYVSESHLNAKLMRGRSDGK